MHRPRDATATAVAAAAWPSLSSPARRPPGTTGTIPAISPAAGAVEPIR